MPPTEAKGPNTPALTVRYEVLAGDAFGAWRYHLTNAAGRAPCGVTGTGSTTDTEQAAALRLLLGHDEGDATWCPTCRAQLAGWIDPPDDGEPDGPAAWRQRAAEAEAIDPDPEGGNA